eukprot:8366080-Alexandrium_andersonii.AAC.1
MRLLAISDVFRLVRPCWDVLFKPFRLFAWHCLTEHEAARNCATPHGIGRRCLELPRADFGQFE